jgi:hypothetical protein
MNNILSYPETQPYDFDLFCGVVEFLLEEVGLDIALDLLTCLLEAL